MHTHSRWRDAVGAGEPDLRSEEDTKSLPTTAQMLSPADTHFTISTSSSTYDLLDTFL